MKFEKSCGAVVFTRGGGEIRYVIVCSVNGYYGYPKGHVEAGESEQETALREIKEETGLDVVLREGFRTTDEYMLQLEGYTDIHKQVVYFLAEYEGQAPSAQPSEIAEIKLMTFEEALAVFQFEGNRRILREAHNFLMIRDEA